MIQVSQLNKSFASIQLLSDVCFTLSKGEKLGLVGKNGSGKSTLFNILLNKIDYDSGEISIPKNYTIGNLEQHIQFSKNSVIDECMQVLPEEEHYDYYKAEKLLFGLGFEEKDMQKHPSTFSGGYQIRINLVKALLKNPHLLLLDEPTNYLDIVSLRWLKFFLKTFPGEVIIITHDRDFMDSVATHIMGIKRTGVKKIKGNTSKYYEKVEEEDRIYEQTRVNQEKKRKQIEGFISRFKAKASKAVQAQSRMKQLDKMDSFDKLMIEKSMGLRFQYQNCPAKILLQAKDLSFSYTKKEEDRLFSNLSFTIQPNDRIAIIGKNGKGKSTLLNVLAEELKPDSGSLQSHNLVKKGHFGQTNIGRLNVNASIKEEVASCNASLSITQVHNICGSMMFEGDLSDKKIKVLSGGERSRVLLGKILAYPTNLLLLDEPTNHLDMESVEILSNELSVYEGAVVLVTHSEALLHRLANKIIIFQKSGVQFFDGTYQEFLDKWGWDEEAGSSTKTAKKKRNLEALNNASTNDSTDDSTINKKFQSREDLVKEKNHILRPIKKQLDVLEKNIAEKEKNLEKESLKLNASSSLDASVSRIEKAKQIQSLGKSIASQQKVLNELFFQYESLLSKYDSKKQIYTEKIKNLDRQ
ncbi:MAG: ABC-F family ATP-binding cassette domain-containing protein [Bdellovibrionaceae bacterium]|nr:ABC-F family ATP-binding cassette domain-containing protein [Pseudobdellovibrionaceae bacterium]